MVCWFRQFLRRLKTHQRSFFMGRNRGKPQLFEQDAISAYAGDDRCSLNFRGFQEIAQRLADPLRRAWSEWLKMRPGRRAGDTHAAPRRLHAKQMELVLIPV